MKHVDNFGSNDEQTRSGPPTLNDYLFPILQANRDKLPEQCPRTADAAIRWWVERQEPRAKWEQPHTVSVSGSRTRWVDNYLQRLAVNLKEFCGLTRGYQQRIISAWDEERIPWRGDDEKMFDRIISETRRFRTTPREQFVAKLKQDISKLTTEVVI